MGALPRTLMSVSPKSGPKSDVERADDKAAESATREKEDQGSWSGEAFLD